MGLTAEKLHELVKALYDQPREPYKIRMPAYDYPELNDEEFKIFVNQKDVTFVGGREGIDLLINRCKKLNIPT